ncbi:ABC transporter permease [Roseomonas sp. HJA6]|uniref:ABC transporter permease n=1 Tax=Roseomonas alba TaxID=2846776 RepID=A0ABS7A7G8_9PROT|nr:ABC transporter permease [Neoroseomonas alba]MBW6398246.1 ABC transporter permease [Neoroseomonas alba]
MWVLRRIGVALVLVWIVASVVFLAIRLVPGDPAEIMLSQGGVSPDAAVVAELRDQLGLDRSIWDQYRANFQGLLSGDLGVSLTDQASVSGQVFARLPRTLELIAVAALVSVLTGIPLGLLAALRRGGWFDRLAMGLAGLSLSVPVFVVGTLLVLVFAQWLALLPAGGFTPFRTDPTRHVAQVLMPAITIASSLAPVLFGMTRAAVIDVITRDHVRTARAKGVAPAGVVLRHVLRNALIPVVTVLALHLGTLLGGTVLVEYVFNYPGLSGLLVDAVNARDYPMVQGVVLVISVLFVALNLTMDLVYGVLDPRVRRA